MYNISVLCDMQMDDVLVRVGKDWGSICIKHATCLCYIVNEVLVIQYIVVY